jgi:hypothetical protein
MPAIFARNHGDNIALVGADILDLSIQLLGYQIPGRKFCNCLLSGTVRQGPINGIDLNQFG